MRTAVFSATGRTGQPLIKQALKRRHEVAAFVLDPTGLRSAVRNADPVSVLESDPYICEMPEIADA